MSGKHTPFEVSEADVAFEAAWRAAWEAYFAGQPGMLMGLAADDIVYEMHGDPALMRMTGRWEGKDGVAEALGMIAEDFAPQTMNVIDVQAQAGCLTTWFENAWVHRASGKTLQVANLIVWRYADGQVYRLDEYIRTSELKRAFGAL